MRVLFNRKFLQHNAQSQAEGAYRLGQFPDCYPDEECDGERFITLVHTESHREKIKNACQQGERLAEVTLNPDSYSAALTAVGLSVMAAEQCDFAVVRPPGHHAGRESFAGFCFFNNVAIAAQHLAERGKRVFIFDFDGHHGDGTQSIFYESDQVFYSSVHQAFTYPMTGMPHEKGKGKGEGFTLNIPLMPGAGDTAFLRALDLVLAKAREFEPDVIAVSAGFDGFRDDLLLGLDFTMKGYYECGFRLRRAFPRIFAVLEGGYHNHIKECVEAFISGVNVGSRPIKNSFDHNMSIG